MPLIIPAINTSDFKVVQERIFTARTFLPPDGWIHIDVVDGRFAMNVTWGDPEEFGDFLRSHITLRRLNFEIHLMVKEPEKITRNWFDAGARRLIVHEEALVNPDLIMKQCVDYAAEIMIAAKPDTSVEAYLDYAKQFKSFQVLAVAPGWAGQEFKPEILKKISSLRERVPNATIEVDGGMNPETVKKCREAGADYFVAASYIFGSATPIKAYQELVSAAEG